MRVNATLDSADQTLLARGRLEALDASLPGAPPLSHQWQRHPPLGRCSRKKLCTCRHPVEQYYRALRCAMQSLTCSLRTSDMSQYEKADWDKGIAARLAELALALHHERERAARPRGALLRAALSHRLAGRRHVDRRHALLHWRVNCLRQVLGLCRCGRLLAQLSR